MANRRLRSTARRSPLGRHGPIKRIVDSGVPMQSLYAAHCERLFREAAALAATGSTDAACEPQDGHGLVSCDDKETPHDGDPDAEG